MAHQSAKRKREETANEGRKFQDKWTNEYFFIERSSGPMCLICNKVVAENKEYNIRRHYETMHKVLHSLQGKLRAHEISKLKKQNKQTITNFLLNRVRKEKKMCKLVMH